MSKSNTGASVPALLTVKVIGTRITLFLKNYTNMAKECHSLLVQCMLHAQEHGDCGPMQRLIHGMYDSADSTRSKAFGYVKGAEAWIREFSPIAWDNNGVFALRKGDKAPEWRVELANQTPFWMLNDQAAPDRTMDLEALLKAIQGFIKRAETKDSEGLYEGDVQKDIAIAKDLQNILLRKAPVLQEVITEEPRGDALKARVASGEVRVIKKGSPEHDKAVEGRASAVTRKAKAA